MEHMEHMKMKWEPRFNEGREAWNVITKEENPWFVMEIAQGFFGDETGEKTAQLICDEHNKNLG